MMLRISLIYSNKNIDCLKQSFLDTNISCYQIWHFYFEFN